MPGPASFAGKYPQFTNQMSGAPWMMNSGGGPTLSSNGGVGSYNPTVPQGDLASVLAGGGGGPLASERLSNMGMGYGGRPYNVGAGGFQKPGGKPSIGTAGGGGKPSIGYGGGPSRAMWK